MGFSAQVFGVAEAQTFLLHKQEKVVHELTGAMDKAGLLMERAVKSSIAGHEDESASVDTGNFLNSVTSAVSSDTANKQQQAIIFTMVDYAKYLEYGTSRLYPRAHFLNSYIRNRAACIQLIDEAVKKAIA